MSNKASIESTERKPKKSRVTQKIFPLYDIESALKIAKAIKDNFAGKPTPSLLVADACEISPTSSHWRYLTGASVAYGLTQGVYNSKVISLTPLGEQIVSPLQEGDDAIAIIEAIMSPVALGKLYNQYDGNKIPRPDILRNVIQKEGVPVERLDISVSIFMNNASFANILLTTSGNEFIHLNPPTSYANQASQTSTTIVNEESDQDISLQAVPKSLLEKINVQDPSENEVSNLNSSVVDQKPRVFISHGKNNQTIVGQLKELITYGQMEPVVSVDRETTAIPVPDKVFDDMRACDAGIIHVDLEEKVCDNGETFNCLNENVLIEIGAAMALYKKRVVLLCRKGTVLPSNLQGLYLCQYDDSQLDYSATMKLLKTLQELRGFKS